MALLYNKDFFIQMVILGLIIPLLRLTLILKIVNVSKPNAQKLVKTVKKNTTD